ncbi:MAG: hypothetical protein ABI721_04205 [Candidatus Dojkabacteria bacterium]
MSIWDDAINTALNKPANDPRGIERRREASVLSTSLAKLMEMYEYNLSILFRDDHNQIHNILTSVDPDDESLFHRNTFSLLIKSLKDSILSENYDENYDKALEVLLICLEYYINEEGYREMKTATESFEKIIKSLESGTILVPDDLEKEDRVSSLAEGDTKHYTIFTENELASHLELLKSQQLMSKKLNFGNIEERISNIIDLIEDYYKNKSKLDSNFTERGFVENPKAVLEKSLLDDKEKALKANFTVAEAKGMFPFEIRVSNDPSNEPEGDDLIKKVLSYFYEQLIKNLDNVVFSNQLKQWRINSFTEQVRDYIQSLIEVMEVQRLHDIIDDNKDEQVRFEKTLDSTELNWATGISIRDEVKGWVETMKRDFI